MIRSGNIATPFLAIDSVVRTTSLAPSRVPVDFSNPLIAPVFPVRARRHVLGVLMFCGLIFSPLAGNADTGEQPISNLSLMRELAVEIGTVTGGNIPQSAGSDTLWALVRPRETAWYVESSLLQGVTSQGYKVLSGDHGPLTVEFGITEMSVRYQDARAEGIFGETIMDREVMVTISTRVANNSTGEILVDEEITKSKRDTVAIADVSLIENPNIAVTRGEMPDEGFFSTIAGPVIVLGALGVAVFLLFHVRS